MKVQVSTTIASPPSEVAELTSHARNQGQWHTDVLETSLTSGNGVERRTTSHLRTTPAIGGVTEGTRKWALRSSAVQRSLPSARAASSVAASISVKVPVSILSINGPANRPSGPPRGT
jgi:hypothetical protein